MGRVAVRIEGGWHRALILKDGENVTVQFRNQKDLTRMYPSVAAAGRGLKAQQGIVDGEARRFASCSLFRAT